MVSRGIPSPPLGNSDIASWAAQEGCRNRPHVVTALGGEGDRGREERPPGGRRRDGERTQKAVGQGELAVSATARTTRGPRVRPPKWFIPFIILLFRVFCENCVVLLTSGTPLESCGLSTSPCTACIGETFPEGGCRCLAQSNASLHPLIGEWSFSFLKTLSSHHSSGVIVTSKQVRRSRRLRAVDFHWGCTHQRKDRTFRVASPAIQAPHRVRPRCQGPRPHENAAGGDQK